MDGQFAATLVTALGSLLVAAISIVTSYRTVRAAERMRERELQRRLTEKLLDLRLSVYPTAYALTDRLRGEHPTGQPWTFEQLSELRSTLLDWHRGVAAFVISGPSVAAVYSLCDVLRPPPGATGEVSDELWMLIRVANKEFRRSLRRDLELLADEEIGF